MNELYPGHYQVTRKNHQKHLTRIMPLVALIYGGQIMIMSAFTNEFIQDSLWFTGFALVSFLVYFYWYDQSQKTIITPQKIVSEFHPFYEQRAINITDIIKVIIHDSGSSFGSLTLVLQNGDHQILSFVDNPDEVASIIENYRSATSMPPKMAA